MFVGNNGLIGKKAPELARVGRWINSAPLRLGYDLRGRLVLLAFWTSTDPTSLRALPVLNAWHRQYGQLGLAVIGVHVPDFEFERRSEVISRCLAAYGVAFPVLLDNQSRTAHAFSCECRPSFYLVDARGIVRHVQAGEGEYFATERLIRELLEETGTPPPEPLLVSPEGAAVRFYPTPRLYCGYVRGLIGNGPDEAQGHATAYTDSGDYEEGRIYLQGVWIQEQECVRHARQTAAPVDYLAVRYRAYEVQAVMGSSDGYPLQVLVSWDGVALPPSLAGRDVAVVGDESRVTVAEPRLYELVADVAFGSHVLRLATDSERLQAYALDFGGRPRATSPGR